MRFQEPQRLVQVGEAAVKMSAVVASPASAASSMLFRIAFATAA